MSSDERTGEDPRPGGKAAERGRADAELEEFQAGLTERASNPHDDTGDATSLPTRGRRRLCNGIGRARTTRREDGLTSPEVEAGPKRPPSAQRFTRPAGRSGLRGSRPASPEGFARPPSIGRGHREGTLTDDGKLTVGPDWTAGYGTASATRTRRYGRRRCSATASTSRRTGSRRSVMSGCATYGGT